MESLEKQNFILAKWVTSTFLGWLLGFILILVLSVILGAIGVENVQFFTGTGMGLGVGFMQWRVIRRISIDDKRWIWYSVIGLTIPYLIFDLINLLFSYSLGVYLLPVCTGLGGLTTGLLQFRILRASSLRARLWIIASFAGWILAALTVSSMDYIRFMEINNLIGFAINITLILGGGVVLGFITGMFLRNILERK